MPYVYYVGITLLLQCYYIIITLLLHDIIMFVISLSTVCERFKFFISCLENPAAIRPQTTSRRLLNARRANPRARVGGLSVARRTDGASRSLSTHSFVSGVPRGRLFCTSPGRVSLDRCALSLLLSLLLPSLYPSIPPSLSLCLFL